MKNEQYKKRMKIMLIIVGILFGSIFLYKMARGLLLNYSLSHRSNAVTVATLKTGYTHWEPKITASASLRAIQGVNITTELAGMVQTIYFTPGASVKEGDILVQLNADNDIALLHSLEANVELAKITYERDKAQLKIRAVSRQTVDIDAANLKSLTAQVAQQAAIVGKKTIRAPFAGRLGINLVNAGQYLNPGDAITMLQTLDPIYADFNVPQQSLSQLKVGQLVSVTSDAFPGVLFSGKLTTINPGVDSNTRNAVVEATISNVNNALAPGMFVTINVTTGAPKQYLTVPQTAIVYNPYGNIVYIVQETKEKDSHDKPILIANQSFVITGETRGDQITILKGLKAGDIIVASGQIKLKNGTQIAVNNSVMPANNPAPDLVNEH